MSIRSTKEKSVHINLHSNYYGTIAEIGGGQETARFLFQAGGASNTVAKSISAYDKLFSDSLYNNGIAERYVSEERLRKMVSCEYQELLTILTHKDDKKFLKVNEKEKMILEFIKEQRLLRKEELIKTDRKQSENFSLEKIYQRLCKKFDMEEVNKEIQNSDGIVMRLPRFSFATLHRLLSDNPNNVEARLEHIKRHQENKDKK